MTKKLSTWLVVALTGGAFVAGCGSSSNNATSSGRATPQGQATTTGQTNPAATVNSPAVQRAVEFCKQKLLALPTAVPGYAKESLAGVCEKDAHEGAAAVREASVSLCLNGIYNASPPIGGAAKKHLMRTICERSK